MRLQEGIDVAILADWTWTYQYVTAHADRAAMFAVLGFAIGAILLLVFLIVRLLAVRRRVPSKSSSPVTTSSSSPSTIDRHHHQQHKQPPKQQQQQQQHSNTSSTFPPENSESVALLSSSSVAHCPPGGVVFSTGSDDVYNASSLSRNSQRRRPDRVHFAPPSDAELTAASGAGRSQGTSFTDDTMASPSSTATSLNDVFFPASSSTPGPAQQQQLPRQTTTTTTTAVARLWQMPGGVLDGDGLDDVDVGALVRNDTSRGSFYSNPYRHDTIDGRIRTSRAK